MAFRLPPASHEDTPALSVLSQILSSGQSSRLYRSLVREKQLAVEAEGTNVSLRLGGLFFFFAIASAGKDPAAIEAALREQVERLRNEPVTADELAKAKNQVLTSEVFGKLSTEDKANALGQADVVYGDPEEANREFDKINRVTAEDVQRVARTYFAPNETNVFLCARKPAAQDRRANKQRGGARHSRSTGERPMTRPRIVTFTVVAATASLLTLLPGVTFAATPASRPPSNTAAPSTVSPLVPPLAPARPLRLPPRAPDATRERFADRAFRRSSAARRLDAPGRARRLGPRSQKQGWTRRDGRGPARSGHNRSHTGANRRNRGPFGRESGCERGRRLPDRVGKRPERA
jgi:hypothetical protein